MKCVLPDTCPECGSSWEREDRSEYRLSGIFVRRRTYNCGLNLDAHKPQKDTGYRSIMMGCKNSNQKLQEWVLGDIPGGNAKVRE